MCNLKFVPLWLSLHTIFVQTNYSTSKRRGCNCTVLTQFSWQLIGLLLQPKTDCFIKHKTNCGGWCSNHSRWDHTNYLIVSTGVQLSSSSEEKTRNPSDGHATPHDSFTNSKKRMPCKGLHCRQLTPHSSRHKAFSVLRIQYTQGCSNTSTHSHTLWT